MRLLGPEIQGCRAALVQVIAIHRKDLSVWKQGIHERVSRRVRKLVKEAKLLYVKPGRRILPGLGIFLCRNIKIVFLSTRRVIINLILVAEDFPNSDHREMLEMKTKTELFRMKIAANRQVTVPARLLDILGVTEGDEIRIEIRGSDALSVEGRKSVPARLPEELRAKLRQRTDAVIAGHGLPLRDARQPRRRSAQNALTAHTN